MDKKELTEIRRKDRAITDDRWIIAFLNKADYGVFATCKAGQPFTVARNFVYDAERHAIYFHGARSGRTFDNIGNGALVNLNVSEMGDWIIDERASGFSVEYKGVVVFGSVKVVEEADEARHGLQLLMEKHFPDRTYEVANDQDVMRTAVFRMDIDAWSGKENKRE